jgi:hypothetical protein
LFSLLSSFLFLFHVHSLSHSLLISSSNSVSLDFLFCYKYTFKLLELSTSRSVFASQFTFSFDWSSNWFTVSRFFVNFSLKTYMCVLFGVKCYVGVTYNLTNLYQLQFSWWIITMCKKSFLWLN